MNAHHPLAWIPKLVVVTVLLGCVAALADSDSALKNILGDDVQDGWIYDDIDAGIAKARETGKPLLVAFR